MSGTMTPRMTADSIRDSVYLELTRDFRVTLRATKRVLGEKHMLTTLCMHASLFPSDRMSARMVWDQFGSLPLAQRTDILQALRCGAI